MELADEDFDDRVVLLSGVEKKEPARQDWSKTQWVDLPVSQIVPTAPLKPETPFPWSTEIPVQKEEADKPS